MTVTAPAPNLSTAPNATTANPPPLPPLRIALHNVTTTIKVGGVETFVWELARHLAAAGHTVDVIGGSGDGGLGEEHVPGVRVRRAPFIRREWLRRLPLLDRLYGPTKLIERLSFGLTTLPWLLRGHYDILHIQKPFDLPVSTIVRRVTRGKTKLIFGCHGRDFFAGDRRWTGAIDATVSCSATNAAEVAEHYGLTPRVIYNGIDIDSFVPRPRTDPAVRAWRERLTGGQERPVLLQASRMVRWKGAEYAIEALSLLRTEPAPILALAGDGPYRAELARLAKAYGVADRVLFLGDVPHEAMTALFPAIDLLLGTSFVNETFGITLCEALSCERAVIASDFGGFREVLRHGETGLLVPPQDPVALATAIDALLADDERRAVFGVAGRADVAARFSWPAVVERVLAAYEEALG
jgi:D-inositol-3-phosphate glycosyltransferase